MTTLQAIVMFNPQGVITDWDEGAYQLYGYTKEEALQKYWLLIIPPEKYEELSTVMQKVKSGERIEHLETMRMKKDGAHINVSLSIVPLKDNEDRIIGIQATTTVL